MSNRIDEYWADVHEMSLEEYLHEGIRVIPVPQKWAAPHDENAGVSVAGRNCIVEVRRPLVGELRRRTKGLAPEDLGTREAVEDLFQGLAEHVSEVTVHAYAEEDDFKPVPSSSVRSAREEDLGLLQELGKIKVVDVILPTRQGVEIRKRCITQPTDHQAILLQKLGLRLPNSIEIKEM